MPSLGRGLPTRKGKSSSSSGSRRRARGLPLASGGASGNSSAGNSSPTPSSDSPSAVLSSSSIRRNSSPAGGTKKKNSSSANSPTIKTDNTPSPSTKKHPQILEAKLDKADAIKFNGSRSGSMDWTVELLLDGKPYVPPTCGIIETLNIKREEGESSSSRPRRKRTETIEPGPADGQEEEEDSDLTPSDRASPAPAVRESSFTKKMKGKDGNFHYCKVCREVGDVVCCDGCPQVYHPQCLPADSDSFAALDLQHDDDPWYCPDCVEKRKQEGKLKTKKNKKRKASGSPTNEMLSPYRQSRPKRKCSIDATEMIENEMRDGNGSPVAIAVKDEDASDDEVSALSSPSKTPSKPNRLKSPTSTTKKSTPGISIGSKKKSKNKKQKTSSSSRPMSPIRLRAASPTPSKSEAGSSAKKKDKKKKKKKKKNEYGDDNDGGVSDRKDGRKSKKSGKKEGGMLTHMLNNNTGMVKATPAFYFFLNDARNKIERNLSRKHRYFNRLPKANMERNQLIAKEGIVMWMKLKEGEIQNYIEISMKDFERRIIEWKEEKTIRQMFAVSEEGDPDEEQTLNEEINRSGNSMMEDERIAYENHQRLYLSTTVGSKPYKPDMEESNNRILLELLQDTRFHPLPMIQPNRSAREYGEMDFDRVTIPYFDINGPVSTCLGDECLGCSRGWTHFCNVLKRRIPAVPRRAKLQPPLSSLVATRIGLGLKDPPLANDEDDAEAEKRNGSSSKIIKHSGGGDVEVFSSRDVQSAVQAKALPLYPWESLTAPTERADDIVRFVEEAVCMKIPEPPRPGDDDPETTGGIDDDNSMIKSLPSVPTSILGLNLPSRGRKRRTEDADDFHDGDDEDVTVNKCGRCRTIIEGDTGCVPCRRAQLVINMSRGEGIADESSKMLQVQTNMLGRIVVRDGEVETQPGGDEAVANHILRQRWTPFSILPPTTLTSPIPRFDDDSEDYADDDNSGEDDENSGDDEEEDNVDEIAEEGSDSMEITSEKDDIDVLNTVSDDTMGSEEESSSVTTGEDDIPARPSKRLRASSRIEALEGNGTTTTVSSTTKIVDTHERNILIKKFKEEANSFHKKCVSIACTGLLLGLTRRDPLLHFAEPVDAEGYHDIIHEPMDFGKIKKKVFRKKYSTLGAFCSDARLLCSNAMVFNPPDSIYYKTAKELNDALTVMHKRAMEWLTTMKDAHAATFNNIFDSKPGDNSSDDDIPSSSIDDEKAENTNSSPFLGGDPFVRLRKEWPEAVEMFEDNKWLHKAVETDFMRTKENESAYYGVMAIRRAAMAAAASLAPYTDSGGMFNTVGRRNYHEDEKLRAHISEKVAEAVNPPELKEIPHWREEMIMRVLRKSQARRMEGRMGSMHGCARCDGVKTTDLDTSKAMNAATVRWGRTRKKPNEVPRIHKSRLGLSTGLGSQVTQDRIQKHKTSDIRKGLRKGKVWALVAAANKVNEVAVTARGSRIHGMGLFADQPLQKGDVVAEYVGEYVSPAVTDAREKTYQCERIQDYQFRIDSHLVIDATKRGGHGRYANHNCDPNCATKIIPFEIPSKENSDGIKTIRTSKNSILKRVVIVAQRDIESREELTYDYQFPLEVNMNERIPCNCNSELCRGFMNWDLPEKGAKNQVFRTQKRGANMRDRIRRLGRPLKGDK